MLTTEQEQAVRSIRSRLTRAYGGVPPGEPTPRWMTQTELILETVEAQAEQITALRAGQGHGTHHRTFGGPVATPLHEAHPIPDSTKGTP